MMGKRVAAWGLLIVGAMFAVALLTLVCAAIGLIP